MRIAIWLDTFGHHDLDGQPVAPDYEFVEYRVMNNHPLPVRWSVEGPGGEHPTMTFEQVVSEIRRLRRDAKP